MDGFRILIEAAKKKRKSIDTTKASHPKIGFPGYAFGSNPGDRPNETHQFTPSLGKGPDMPAPTPVHQQGDNGDYCGVIAMGGGGCGGGGSVGPVVALTGGGGGDGGAAAAEAVEADQINAIIESYKQANPSNDTIGEIQKMFEGVRNGFGMIYQSCDGASAMTMVPASDEQIATLAATCEASLAAFRKYTGHDYLQWRK
jgi:hypothetical protein